MPNSSGLSTAGRATPSAPAFSSSAVPSAAVVSPAASPPSPARRRAQEAVRRAREVSQFEAPSAPLRAEARLEFSDGRAVDLEADGETGEFPIVRVEAESRTRIQVRYFGAGGVWPSEVSVHVEDGGRLGNGEAVQVCRLEGEQMGFEFVASDQAGHHRLTLRRGVDRKVLDLWVEKEREP